MPRQVDHEARRRQIAEAVWTITATRGLEAVSLREVAAEAGVSMGMVQHYFKTKDAMLLFACEHMVERGYEETQALTAASDDPASARTAIRNVFVEALPHSPERRLATSVWFAFLTRAAIVPELATFILALWDGAHAFVVAQLQRARGDGLVADGVDLEREAVTLVALIDGLTAHVMLGHGTADAAMDAVDAQLDRLFVDTREHA